VTSPDPRASDGTLGTDATPRRLAIATVFGMPTSCSSRAAARLLEVLSAERSVNSGVSRCSSSGIQSPCSVAIGSSR
jgi:hypothetical protein